IGGLHAGFPDMRLEEEAVVAEGDLVASRWTVSGTHTGPFAGLPPSGNRFSITGMSFYRVVDGKIVEGWVNDDNLGMARQLGALPSPEPV
ncbi:MAG TPA: ester cyclase, partial [Longimicrobiaceae bacterium]|nr:ester cyclase [Longimicrobiaceae bacterium]